MKKKFDHETLQQDSPQNKPNKLYISESVQDEAKRIMVPVANVLTGATNEPNATYNTSRGKTPSSHKGF